MTATQSAHTALLPTKTRINPTDPFDSEFYDSKQVGYLLRGGVEGQDRHVFATSYGSIGEGWLPGTIHHIRHDQTGGDFGYFKVTAIYVDGKLTAGEAWTGRTIPHYVFK